MTIGRFDCTGTGPTLVNRCLSVTPGCDAALRCTTDTYGYVGDTETVAVIVGSTTTTRVSALDGDGSRVATRDGTTTGFLIPDLHGNVAAAEATAGTTIINALRYDGYGQRLGSAYATPTGAIAMDATYQGRLDLSATDDPLYDMSARFYAPGTGTFTALDSVTGSAQDPLSMNRFLYAEANPATFIDPTGHYVSEGDSTPDNRCNHRGDSGCGKTASTSSSAVRDATTKPTNKKDGDHGNGKGATWRDKGDEKHTPWIPPSLKVWLHFTDQQRDWYIHQYLGQAEEWETFGQDDASMIVYWILMRGDPGLALPPTDVMFDLETIDRLGTAIDAAPRTFDTGTTAVSFRAGGDHAMWDLAMSSAALQYQVTADALRTMGARLPVEVVERIPNGLARYLGQEETSANVTTVGASGGARAGKDFTRRGRDIVIRANKEQNGGAVVCANCGIEVVPGQQSRRGVTPPDNELAVDHIIPKSGGGDGAPPNGQVLCRVCNGDKGTQYPWP